VTKHDRVERNMTVREQTLEREAGGRDRRTEEAEKGKTGEKRQAREAENQVEREAGKQVQAQDNTSQPTESCHRPQVTKRPHAALT
jgi:hypothetical protein